MARSSEPLWWSLFSAGGVVAAFLFPATIFVTGVAVPAGWISAEALYELIRHPLVRLYLFVLISLPLFHAAHRFRHTALDLGLTRLERPLGILCYGAAILAALLAGFLLVSGP